MITNTIVTKYAISFVLTAAVVVAVSSSDLIAADPPQPISVRVQATDSGSPADRFLVADPQKDDVIKEVERALRRSPGLTVTTPGDATPVTIVLGVTNVCESMGAELHPNQPAVARQMFWVIDTDDAVVSNGGTVHHVRSFTGSGPDRSFAIEAVAKDFVSWVAANRASLLAGKK